MKPLSVQRRAKKARLAAAQTLQQARARQGRGDLAACAQLCAGVLEADPTNFDALYLMGIVQHQQGATAAALEFMARALRVRPDAAEAIAAHGALLIALDRPQEALTDIDRALARNPHDAVTHYNRGKALQAL